MSDGFSLRNVSVEDSQAIVPESEDARREFSVIKTERHIDIINAVFHEDSNAVIAFFAVKV